MSQRDNRVYIQHMIDNSHKAINFVKEIDRKDFDNDEKLRLVLTHLLQIIGEAARRISIEFRESHPEISWKEIVGMRSKVVHDYLNMDEDIVWATIKYDLRSLIPKIEKLL